ncbi:MAG TPA: hypothetical protein VHO50_09555 [Bacteroidales bacterium]|nr:hypothetical protein [Bacteroidales bacterium]
MKYINLFQILVITVISLSGCSKDDFDNQRATAEVGLNTLFNIKAVNNGFILSGMKDSRLTITRLDANFNQIWQRNNYEWGEVHSEGGWGGAFYSVEVVDVFQKQNGNYVCFCSTMEGGCVIWHSILIVTLDKFGNEIHKIEFENDLLLSVIATNDDGYLLFGGKLIKLNSDLSKAWENDEQNYFFSGAYVSPMNDNGFAITGTWNSEQVYLQKFNDAGALQWVKKNYNKLPFNDLGCDVRQLPDKGFLVIGRTRSHVEPWDMNCYLIRTDMAGDTIWTKEFGTESNEWLEKFLYASDKEFVLKETVGFPGDPIQKSILLRIDDNGQIIDSKETKSLKLLYTSYGYFIKVDKTDNNNIMTLSKVHLNDLF